MRLIFLGVLEVGGVGNGGWGFLGCFGCGGWIMGIGWNVVG